MLRQARPYGRRTSAKVPVEVGLMNETGYPHHGTLDYVAPTSTPSPAR